MTTAYKQKEEYTETRILPQIREYEGYACEDDGGYEEWLDRLDITDDYMFAHVMKNEEICKGVVSCLFPEHKIDKIRYVAEPEERTSSQESETVSVSYRYKSAAKGRRIFKAPAKLYNIHMQIRPVRQRLLQILL